MAALTVKWESGKFPYVGYSHLSLAGGAHVQIARGSNDG